MRILVADDAGFIRQVVKEALAQASAEAGYVTLYEASTGPEALEMALNQAPDVCLIDMVLPGMSGWQVAKQIKQVLPATRLIAFTSLEWSEVKAIINDSFEFDGYLKKPFKKHELFDVLNLDSQLLE